jgi:hypothetical protein
MDYKFLAILKYSGNLLYYNWNYKNLSDLLGIYQKSNKIKNKFFMLYFSI